MASILQFVSRYKTDLGCKVVRERVVYMAPRLLVEHITLSPNLPLSEVAFSQPPRKKNARS